jgi:hypothetical protein
MKSKTSKPRQPKLFEGEVEPERENQHSEEIEADPEAHVNQCDGRKRLSQGQAKQVQQLSVPLETIEVDEQLQAVMSYAAVIRQQAIANHLSPAMTMFSCLELIGNIIRNEVPIDQRDETLATCMAELWKNYDITENTTIN